MTAAVAVTQDGECPNCDMSADWWSFFNNVHCTMLGRISEDLGTDYSHFFDCYGGGHIAREDVAAFREHLMKLRDFVWEAGEVHFSEDGRRASAPDNLPFEADDRQLGYLVKKTLHMNVIALILLCSLAIERGESLCLCGD